MKTTYSFNHREWGDRSKPPVLFLHGFLGCTDDWSDIATHIAADYRSVAVDLPGHGRTKVDGYDENYRMENVATGVVRFMDSHDINKCDLVAYSMGGRVGLYLAVEYPQRFGRIILESASPGLITEKERRERREHDRELARQLEKNPLEQFLIQWYEQPLFASLKRDRDRFSGWLSRRLEYTEDNPATRKGLATSLRMMGTGSQPSLWSRLSELPSCLLIVGQLDAKFRQIANDMAATADQLSVRVVENTGHNVHWEKPRDYARIVMEFLSTDR
ncbi:MAG: 2-succinyl-6-hydroxy-2,4-cyclohexadiene-1-carboxylate synthase [bacterium]